ncbi:ABC transporter [Actinorugispora endophytica]|uniref:ABC-2 type transport system permease protein n=1 Tax=Actinorugispora endophytica TaxID=1605990 RepID=A0A4R6V4D4_9ACTN|nr:ABC transporter [Actinorugispora endophytica]TDQ55124.1 hypothetical protein EV190_101447 [Actinorugispora endophytica]
MTALIGYRLDLVLRSYRWVPPLLLWAVVVAIGSMPGQPLTEALAYNSAALLPAAAWLARVCLLAEPDAARACAAAARGPVRTHLSGVAAALLAGAAPALLGIGVAAAFTGRTDPALRGAADWAGALAVGCATGAACVLVGVAVGALCTTLLERRPAYAVPATGLLTVTALLVAGSPANAAITSVTGGPEATPVQAAALAGALALAAATAWGTALVARRRY